MIQNSWLRFAVHSFVGVVLLSINAKAESTIENRISDLIAQMTLEEKVTMLSGADFLNTAALPRLGIPAIYMNDGPVGVVETEIPTTAFPAGIAMGASFDPSLIHDVAQAIADETRLSGHHMLLGPCVNISRHPFGGRNFENFGEDPFLTSRLAEAYIRGVQERNVIATVKHFALNDQEYERTTIDTRADRRTMFEIYFPPFKAAVDAGSWSVMSSYNLVNGRYAAENNFLLNQTLKKRWGFRGFVVSDWDSTHSTVAMANNGLDLEMPDGKFFDNKLIVAVRKGEVEESIINDKVRRILRAMHGIGLLDPASVSPAPPPLGQESSEHHALALELAVKSAVLLKNENSALPLSLGQMKSIAVIGPNAAKAQSGGGGSSQVTAVRPVSPLEGLRNRLGSRVKIHYALGAPAPNDGNVIPATRFRPSLKSGEQGLHAAYFNNRDLQGTPLFERLDPNIDFDSDKFLQLNLKNDFSVRWSGFVSVPVTGRYHFTIISDDGARLFLNGKKIFSRWNNHGRAYDEVQVNLVANQWYPIRLEYYQGQQASVISLGWRGPGDGLVDEAIAAARDSDAAVIFAGLGNNLESEGADRTTTALPKGQRELIEAVVRVQPRTIVVLTSGNPLTMRDWVAKVPAIMQAWYAGQEGGNAIADLLLGNKNPSGKLPVTFLKRWEDAPAYGNYPGKNGRVEYKEGVFVGYRYYDTFQIAPEFPFGHGLSYTEFAYSDLRIEALDSRAKSSQVRVGFTLTNIGDRDGEEVAQVYVNEVQPSVQRPARELKGFQKVFLHPAERKNIVLELDASAFAFFDGSTMSWKVNPGKFRIEVGSSSRDIRAKQLVTLTRLDGADLYF